MTPIPAPQFSVLTQNGFFSTPWYLFFKQFVTQPGAVQTVSLGASPASYTASGPGSVVVSGGTVSGISLKRGGVTTALGITSGIVPVVNNDVVVMTYSVKPTVSFIPG